MPPVWKAVNNRRKTLSAEQHFEEPESDFLSRVIMTLTPSGWKACHGCRETSTDRSTFSDRSRKVGCFRQRSWYTCELPNRARSQAVEQRHSPK
jgi:hypothetical protein